MRVHLSGAIGTSMFRWKRRTWPPSAACRHFIEMSSISRRQIRRLAGSGKGGRMKDEQREGRPGDGETR